ncbi:MAG TPA: glucose-6-phosphate isomerase [bacterium]|nr:glucose-6-phosphate isomerase [bacterium]
MNEVRIDYTNALTESVGRKNGIGKKELADLTERTAMVHADLAARRKAGELPFYDLPYQNVTKVLQLVSKRCSSFDNVVTLGIGGSGLGARALGRALLKPYNELMDNASRQGCPRLYVADNIDPENFMGLLGALNLSKTMFIVISKSGETAETMSQFLIARDLLIKKYGEDGYRERMISITDQEKGYLREITDRDGLEWLPVPAGVGGRYTVFTPVGLLPAAVCGMDVVALLKGAAAMDQRTREPELLKNPAYLLAALFYLADVKRKKNILVVMPYSSGLTDLAEWFQQLWAESLGKAVHLDGSPAGTGSTPVRALGATDQHSQVQLYKEGPADKLVAFFRVDRFRDDARIPTDFSDIEGVAYLGGHSLGELINAEQLATEVALAKAGRPSLRIELPHVDADVMGQVMYMLEVATVFAGGLYQVNPLDQPGVEAGKRYTNALMGKKGFDQEREEIEKMVKGRKRFIL